MTEQEIFQETLKRCNADKELTAILEKIKNQTATFEDTQRYSIRSAEIRAEVLAQNLAPAGTGHNESVCYQLLREQHRDINQKAAAVQKTLDEQQNLHINPQKAKFPEERARKASHSLEDKTVSQEVIRRRAENAIANIANSFHDDYIKENAIFRRKTGLTCYVNRIGASKCCPWCAEVAGRYEVGREPDGFWRRHDKCSCRIIYENKKVRQRLSGNGRAWKVDSEVQRRIAQSIQYKPAVFTQEQAKTLEQQKLSQYKGLTKPPESGTIELSQRRYTGLFDSLVDKLSDLFAPKEPDLVSQEYLDSLPKLSVPDTMEQTLQTVNPTGDNDNCQHCVPAYVMRRNGYDVIASESVPATQDRIGLGGFKYVFKGSEWKKCSGTGAEQITEFLQEAGHGAIAEVSIHGNNFSHLIVAENRDGQVMFIDPQKNRNDVLYYFDSVYLGTTEFARIDGLPVTEFIKDCVVARK